MVFDIIVLQTLTASFAFFDANPTLVEHPGHIFVKTCKNDMQKFIMLKICLAGKNLSSTAGTDLTVVVSELIS